MARSVYYPHINRAKTVHPLLIVCVINVVRPRSSRCTVPKQPWKTEDGCHFNRVFFPCNSSYSDLELKRQRPGRAGGGPRARDHSPLANFKNYSSANQNTRKWTKIVLSNRHVEIYVLTDVDEHVGERAGTSTDQVNIEPINWFRN